MSGVNKVMLIGNLGKDPEIRHLEGNISVAKFPLATSEVYKNKEGNRVEQTEWHNIVLWRGLAESAEKILKKGSLVFIEGRLKTRTWDDQAGNKRYITEVVADAMTLLARKNDESGSHGEKHTSHPEASSATPLTDVPNDITDNLPF